MLEEYILIEGKGELLPNIEKLWQKLNLHHLEGTAYFKEKYQEKTFDDRRKSLIDKSSHGDIQVLLVKTAREDSLIAYCVSTVNLEGTGEIDSLFVEKEYRRLDLGDQLMKHALHWLESKNPKEVVLTVAGGNERVLDFYKKYGFYTTAVKLARAADKPRTEEKYFNGYLISADKGEIDTPAVTKMLQNSYWAENRSKEAIRTSIENSFCVGVYDQEKQIGFARVVTDYAVFAYLCDVIIDEAYRGKGIGQELLQFVLEHPSLENVKSWSLLTKDAHSLYEKFGFAKPEDPSRYMRRILK